VRDKIVATMTVKGVETQLKVARWAASSNGAPSDPDAFRCRYSTRQICLAAGLIAGSHAKNVDEIRELMSGNIGRCAVYLNVTAAIQKGMGQA
jgi:aerobic-type carbon monoxide dehydrogenase small subunit (CoxS/CutS family)